MSNNATVIDFDYSGLKAYAGHYSDSSKILECASGGAASAISELVIKKGGIVYGVAYSEDYHQAEYKIAETIEQLDMFKGSKYVEVNKKILIDGKYESVYANVIEQLVSGKLVLFIGLGCDVAALLSNCSNKNIDTSNLYTVNLICHGPTYKEVHVQYIDSLERKFNSKLTSFSVRYKRGKWQPSYIHAEFESGKIYEIPFYESDYGNAFKIYLKTSCFNCHFKGANHKADITVGDYWGIKDEMPGYKKEGVSILFTRTQKGEEIISELSSVNFEIFDTDILNALKGNRRYYTCVEKDEAYEVFASNFKEKGLHYAVVKWIGLDKIIKSNIKKSIKRMLGLKK